MLEAIRILWVGFGRREEDIIKISGTVKLSWAVITCDPSSIHNKLVWNFLIPRDTDPLSETRCTFRQVNRTGPLCTASEPGTTMGLKGNRLTLSNDPVKITSEASLEGLVRIEGEYTTNLSRRGQTMKTQLRSRPSC